MAVICRTVFIFVPFFKLMTAVVMITGISFGPEAGFLCGVLSSFVSNFIFGQGPWTPYQMFVFVMAGFLSGLFYFIYALFSTSSYAPSMFGGVVL